MISPGTKTFSVKSPDEEYAALVSRGGLCKPPDIVFITSIHVWVMWCFIRDNAEVRDALMKTSNHGDVFIESFVRKIVDLESIADAKCIKDHSFQPFVRRIASAMFNCIAVNVTNESNSAIHEAKKRKSTKVESTNERKIIKLTSETSIGKTIVASMEDCGECRFCKEKKLVGMAY